MTNEKKRIVVTGVGVATSIGMDETTLWNNMLAGKSGIKRISGFDVSEYKARNAAEIDNSQLDTALKARKIMPSERTVDMGVLVSAQALEQAGLISGEPPFQPLNAATIFGTHGSSQGTFEMFGIYTKSGLRGIRPSSLPRCIPNAVSSQVSMRFRLTGPNFIITAACSSSTTAIGLGFRMIKDGYIDKVVCGGSDAILNPFLYSGWESLGAVSKNPVPEKSCRPFDIDRDGCVLGEGAGAIVIESLDSAMQRGACIRAEILGYGDASDAEHITKPSTEGQARAMTAAIESAGITPADIGFINAHGTATKSNDECEALSIRAVFGSLADNIPVTSNKSFFGHLAGAAGAVETIVTLLGLERGIVPPSLNLDNPDPKCNLNFVGSDPMKINAAIAMKNSFGFGGHNAVLILRKWDK